MSGPASYRVPYPASEESEEDLGGLDRAGVAAPCQRHSQVQTV